jgi:sterol desaturase/sphingolipid hydroxylase (fatty acid hydroxylase superfamily)
MVETLLKQWAIIFPITTLRYFVFAGITFGVFYVWKKHSLLHKKIQKKFATNSDIKREIGYSVLSLFIFSLIGVFVFYLSSKGYTKIYRQFSDHSVAYFIFSCVLMIVVHDTYFYWTHRLMHWKKIYRFVHRTHHLSTNPTPWAAFAFHPLEALVEVGILPLMVFLFPVHPIAIVVWILFMTAENVMGHCGFEIFPSGFTKGSITGLSNTSVHHNMHHRFVNCNYGLYFNFWDKIMGTNHPNYHETFEKTTQNTHV